MKKYLMNQIKNLRVLGRNVPGGICSDGAVRLFWAASAIEISVKAREVWAEISSGYDYHEIWLAVEVNGFQTARFIAPEGPALICLARNLNPEKENLISVIKDTQPMPGDTKHELKISGISLDDDGEFTALKAPSCRIEFIGDSVTSGEGLAGNPDEMDWITQWFCAGKTFAVQLARKMNAEWSTVSQCGWGLCWAWDGDVNLRIPLYYEQVCGILNGDGQKSYGTCESFEFSSGADYVILNLGTNDNSGFHFHDDGKGADGEGGKTIVSAAKKFLHVIRSHNPDAKIIWTLGMLKLAVVSPLVEKGIAEYKEETGDKKVYYLELESMQDLEKNLSDRGSREHPGPVTHRKAAERIYDFIKTL